MVFGKRDPEITKRIQAKKFERFQMRQERKAMRRTEKMKEKEILRKARIEARRKESLNLIKAQEKLRAKKKLEISQGKRDLFGNPIMKKKRKGSSSRSSMDIDSFARGGIA